MGKVFNCFKNGTPMVITDFLFNCFDNGNRPAIAEFLFIGKPDSPKSIEVTCEVKRARVKWKSSFNGGDPQMFIAFAINGQQGTHSKTLPDRGEDESYETFVENLQPSLTYVFYVFARNSHGNSSSDIKSCAMFKGIPYFIQNLFCYSKKSTTNISTKTANINLASADKLINSKCFIGWNRLF